MSMSGRFTIPNGAVAALEAAAHDEAELVRVAAAHFGTSSLAVTLMTAAGTVRDTRILWVNSAFVRLTGYEASVVVGRSTELLAGHHLDRIHASEVEMLRDHPENARFGIVARKQRPDHGWYNVEEHILPIHGAPSATTHHLLFQREIERTR